MIIDDIKELIENITTEGKIISFDIGDKKIGIAISDRQQIVATPHDILIRENINKDTGKLRVICKHNDICAVVIGFPKELDNSEGESCEKIRSFANKFLKKHSIPIFLQDERMSTSESTRLMQEFEFTRKRQNQTDDKIAASLILQTALDTISNIRKSS